MAGVPDLLTIKRNLELEGMRQHIWWRRSILLLLGAFLIAGVANVFGQRPGTARVVTPKAILSVYAPAAARGGDFVEARFHITAKQEIKKAVLKLDPGWAEGMSLNTVEPSPLGQGSDRGRLAFTLGHIPKGGDYILFIQLQVNATNVAWHRRQDVELDDGNQVIARIHHSMTVYP
jgi:hypothetical protein